MFNRQQEARRRVLAYRAFREMKRLGISKTEAERLVADDMRAEQAGNPDIDWGEMLECMQPVQEVRNHQFFTANGVDLASLWVTPVMLKKSIADATEPIRYLLDECGIHDYETQKQGPENKVKQPVIFVRDVGIDTKKMSLYRPRTKMGDPRIWPERMGDFCEPGDEVALAVICGVCVLFNLSRYDYAEAFQRLRLFKTEKEREVVAYFKGNDEGRFSDVAKDLLAQLRDLTGTPLEGPEPKAGSSSKRDTDVGMAVEKALGIPANSKRTPDYHGIELKAWRRAKVAGRENRHALFCQVPNWDESKVKSIREFVAICGYPVRDENERKAIDASKRASAKELRCTVSAVTINSQSLVLRVDGDKLIECQMEDGEYQDLLVWLGKDLRSRLAEKHPETFWISCRSERRQQDGREVFYVEKVHYTRRPMVAQFLSLIEQGVITVDHMIGYRKGQLSERGPSFKIKEKHLSLIFPENIEITL